MTRRIADSLPDRYFKYFAYERSCEDASERVALA